MERSIITIILFASSCLSMKQYRSDYVYNKKTDAFYKFHTESVLMRDAKSACETEGGSLVVPSSDLDIAQVHGMLKQFPDLGDYVWVGEDTYHHDPVEERQIIDLDSTIHQTESSWMMCEVITRSGEIRTMHCYRNLPFVCKVKAKDAPYDSHCGVFAKDYVYFENVGSCYKIPRVVYSWNQAFGECAAEGSHLVVLNSELEHSVVQNYTQSVAAVDGAKYSWFFFAGLRAEKTPNGTPRVFKTIFGQTLKEAGYDQWSENEPNNAGGTEYCGSIFKNDGKYNDLDCSHLYGFICEKEVNKR